jgi:hypothetical protein
MKRMNDKAESSDNERGFMLWLTAYLVMAVGILFLALDVI